MFSESEPFYVINLNTITKKYKEWCSAFPQIQPFYAVKCNDDPMILKALFDQGANFDCASKAEIEKVLELTHDTQRILYAHPCKQMSHLRYAKEVGVEMMTFDNEFELEKILHVYREADSAMHSGGGDGAGVRPKLIIRIATDDSNASCKLSNKFGVDVEEYKYLIDKALEMGLSIAGVSFHVGSGQTDLSCFVNTLKKARDVFDYYQYSASRIFSNEYNQMYILDIGGGFTTTDSIRELSQLITPLLNEFYGVNIIAEPGRYFASETTKLYTNVIGKKEKGGYKIYYINDGLYGSFNNIMYDHAQPQPRLVIPEGVNSESECYRRKYKSVIFGPTCDGIDIVCRDIDFCELNIGEWLCFDNMGAYTMVAGSCFNGFPQPKRIYVNE